MSELRDILQRHVDAGTFPGAVGLVAQGGAVEVAAVGSVDVDGSAAMTPDRLFRIASITKPITAAATMLLVEDGRLGLDDPIGEWLPELATPSVVRTPASPLDDVVPARRPITVTDLLTFRAGWGFPSDFSLPAIGPLFAELHQGPMSTLVPPPDEWVARLARIPLVAQPGEQWLYNTCSDILGALIARVSGSTLADFLAERVFAPLAMADTGFVVPEAGADRFTSFYRPTADGGLELVDAPDGAWSQEPAFASGAGGLVSTVDDWLRFARMLLADGGALLSADSVRLMTTDHLTSAQRDASQLFLEGQGWGFGGSVDVAQIDPWNVPGRYGWVGGTGTAAHITPATGTVAIVMCQVELAGPTPPEYMRDFWRYAARAGTV